ncbi:MAG TPA: hypothetical protein VK797_10650 [Tepidisphaeraceae bacterium]|nr:hypothetical protein [Tepidisphaeraceae bacterium]
MASIDFVEGVARQPAKDIELELILAFLLLEQSQPGPDHFAGITISAPSDRATNELCLLIGKIYVLSRHHFIVA